jgi:hypothetical protein
MALQNHSTKRAESARINGAKSQGPKTPEGLLKARTATFTHGLYATEETLKQSVSQEGFLKLRESFYKYWKPEDEYIATRVDELTFAHWELARLMLVRRSELAELHANTGGGLQAELEACKPGSLVYRLEVRINRHQSTISRLERDIMRLKKFAANQGPSQESLKTNDEPETPQTVEPQNPPAPPVPPTNMTINAPPDTEIRPVM